MITKLEDGTLLLPMRAEDETTGIIGDALVRITPDMPEYAEYLAQLEFGKEREMKI